MDIKNLQCFMAVAEQLNFSRAAQSLYISQPSLSIRISALEEELGTKLFKRTHQKVYLTDEGAALLPAVREILEKINSLPFIIGNVQRSDEAQKKLLIGVDVTEDRSLPVIEKAFSRFQNSYPEVDVQVLDVSLEEYEQKLLKGELDFCLMVLQGSEPVNPLFLSIPLLSEPMVMVAANAEGLSVDELIRTRKVQLLYEGERGLRWNEQYLEFLRKHVPDVQPSYVENVSLLCMNLAGGKILTFFPLTYVEAMNDERLCIFPIDLPQGDITLTLLWNKNNINPAIQLMANEFMTEKAVES